VRELSMRAIGLAPRIEQRDDRVALVGEQAMHGPCTGALVFELAGFAAFIPAPRAALGELEVLAHATMAPARPGRLVDQAEQLGLGGRVDAARDLATQSQRPFPSASMSLTPISFSASDSLAISACASASSRSTPPALTPAVASSQATSAGHSAASSVPT